MEQEKKPNPSAQPTPSRTLRVLSAGFDPSAYAEYLQTLNGVSTLNGNVYFITFDRIEQAVQAYHKFKEDKLPVRYHVYSLFTKFDELLTREALEARIGAILGDAPYNVTYMRIDPATAGQTGSHTGKVVVDRLDDCKVLLGFKDDSAMRLRFYRFDPKKAIKKTAALRPAQRSVDGFQTVSYKKRRPPPTGPSSA